MKKTLVFFVFLMSLSLLMANGLSMNSIGPRSLGFGGAFVGLADDATATYWNPAGLSGQKNSIVVFGADIVPLATYKYKNQAKMIDIDAKSEPSFTDYLSPNLFVTYNMDKIGLGFGAYVPAGLGVTWDGDDLKDFNGPAILDTLGTTNPFSNKKFDWMSKLGVFNFGPSFSYAISEKFSIGTAVNIYYGMMQMDKPDDMLINATQTPGHDRMMDTQTKMDISGIGFGATLGLKWKCMLYDKIDMGLTFRTPITVKFEGDMDIQMQGLGKKDMSMDITWPMWVAYGMSYKPDEKTIVNLDFQYTNWKALDKLTMELKDMPMQDGTLGTKKEELEMDWEDAIQIRLGVERKISKLLSLRIGYYNDPAPAPDKTLNIIFPSSSNNVLTLGTGLHFEKFTVDYGMEYLFGEERKVEETETNMPGTHQMDVFAFSLGVSFGF